MMVQWNEGRVEIVVTTCLEMIALECSSVHGQTKAEMRVVLCSKSTDHMTVVPFTF